MEKDVTQFQQDMLNQLSDAFTTIPFNQMIGLSLESLSAEEVIMRFRMKDELIGNYLHGILHGGVISSVLDMAGGMVVMGSAIFRYPDYSSEALREMIAKCSTIDLHVSYLRPGRGVFFIAKAWLIKAGNKICFASMELQDSDSQLIATADGTYLLT